MTSDSFFCSLPVAEPALSVRRGQSERTFLIFAFSSRFFLFFPIFFPLFLIFLSFSELSPLFGKYIVRCQGVLGHLPPPPLATLLLIASHILQQYWEEGEDKLFLSTCLFLGHFVLPECKLMWVCASIMLLPYEYSCHNLWSNLGIPLWCFVLTSWIFML